MFYLYVYVTSLTPGLIQISSSTYTLFSCIIQINDNKGHTGLFCTENISKELFSDIEYSLIILTLSVSFLCLPCAKWPA
jgi:hypothetical protein